MTIHIDRDRRTAILQTQSSSYVLAWDSDSTPLRHLHWGARLEPDDIPALLTITPADAYLGGLSRPRSSTEEYPVWGGLRREEVACKVTMPDGVRSLDLEVTDVEVADTLVVTLRDRHYPVEVALTYRVDEDADSITRQAAIRNVGSDGDIRVERAGSASWALPARPGWRLTTASGTYGAESTLHRESLRQGSFVLASRHGLTGHEFLPWVALDVDASAHHGEVWALTLAWSGSWSIDVNAAHDGAVHVIGGLEPSDPDAVLAPGDGLDLPAMTGVYSPDGHDGAARRFHRFARAHVLVEPDRLRPVLYNSWEATLFTTSFAQQRDLATVAADLGVELFVIDDGWFHGRNDERSGLGDWYPDAAKFPDGLLPLSEHVHGLGMAFGIWVEPEMVNPDSNLFRAHPDWIHRWATREPTLQRHQCVLDFGRPDVREWALETISTLVTDNGVDYLKWDMNRAIVEPSGPNAIYRHVHGVYQVWDELRARFPGLLIEDCASGGGRPDHEALAHTHWAWTSDATDAVDRLSIQRGFARINPASTMCCWITGVPNGLTTRSTPLAFRAHVAMAGGVLGLGMNLITTSDADKALLRDLIADYKEIRPLIHHGTRWELPAPGPGLEGIAYVSETADEALVLAYGPRIGYTHAYHRARVPGLVPDATYRAEVGRASSDASADGLVASGAWLASVGLPLLARGDHASWLIRLRRDG